MQTGILLAVFPGLLALAAAWDLASYTIPNRIQLVMIAVFAVFVLIAGLTLAQLGMHLLAGLIGLAVGFALFALGYVGGGDAKLFACIALWLGLGNLLEYSLTASIFGGLLAGVLLTLRQIPLPPMALNQAWIVRLHDSKSGIPFGVALSVAAIALLPHADIFRHASIS
ncbi:MAG TPA: prepilin peptidase [Rhizomicrobium sp.]|nr:prepilin peptidase [Rhizomicrobium sp.]